mgnify:CR=1 FL=1
MTMTIIESPFAGDVPRNRIYALRCMNNALSRGEVPFAPHLLYPQLLDDSKADERQKGIECGYKYWDFAQTIRFHLDYGWSPGMSEAFERAVERGYNIEVAYIGTNEEPLDTPQYGCINADPVDYVSFLQ